MKSNYEPLGKHIQLVDYRNSEEVTSTVLGISIDKEFMMKMSNSFVRGSSRNPCSVFLLSRISRAIMQYRHAGSAFCK